MIQIPHSHVASGVTKDDEISKDEEVDIFRPGIIKTRRDMFLLVMGVVVVGNTQRTQRKTYKVRLKKKRSGTTCIRIRGCSAAREFSNSQINLFVPAGFPGCRSCCRVGF
jgi:hypothetical protein